jgi:hypothetical protein
LWQDAQLALNNDSPFAASPPSKTPPKALKVSNIAAEKGTRILLIKLLESLFITDILCCMAGLNARQIYTPQAIDIRMTKRMLTI